MITKSTTMATVLAGPLKDETVVICVEYTDGDCIVDLGIDKGLAWERTDNLRKWISVKSVTVKDGKMSYVPCD